jgi:hypothetical protein
MCQNYAEKKKKHVPKLLGIKNTGCIDLHVIGRPGVHSTQLLESNALPVKGSSIVMWLILPYLEHNAYLHQIVYS